MQNIRLARLEALLKNSLTEILFRLKYSNIVIEHLILNKSKDHLIVEISSSNNSLLSLLKRLKLDVLTIKYLLSKDIIFKKVPDISFVEYKKDESYARIDELFSKI